MAITIDTGGIHPTTVSCIGALQWLHERRKLTRVLDMGCGSGILSLTAASLWSAEVLAADIAPEAVDDTERHAQEHGMGGRITAIRSDGFRHPLIGGRAPYDLIIFNLLAEPIVQMAPLVKQHLAAGGVCLLSGILEWLSGEVETAYSAQGFSILHQMTQSPWRTYIMQGPEGIITGNP